jgi:hypothetical protein
MIFLIIYFSLFFILPSIYLLFILYNDFIACKNQILLLTKEIHVLQEKQKTLISDIQSLSAQVTVEKAIYIRNNDVTNLGGQHLRASFQEFEKLDLVKQDSSSIFQDNNIMAVTNFHAPLELDRGLFEPMDPRVFSLSTVEWSVYYIYIYINLCSFYIYIYILCSCSLCTYKYFFTKV